MYELIDFFFTTDQMKHLFQRKGKNCIPDTIPFRKYGNDAFDVKTWLNWSIVFLPFLNLS